MAAMGGSETGAAAGVSGTGHQPASGGTVVEQPGGNGGVAANGGAAGNGRVAGDGGATGDGGAAGNAGTSGATSAGTAGQRAEPGGAAGTAGQGGGGGDGASSGSAGRSATGGSAGGSNCTPRVRWARNFGDLQFQAGRAIAMDALGGVAVTGEFTGTITFGDETFTATPNSDAFVARFDAQGGHVFSLSFGGYDPDVGFGVTIDAAGATIVTGYVRGEVDFGAGLLATDRTSALAFVAKYDTDGDYVFGNRFDGPYAGEGHGVATDSDGNVFAVGWAGPDTDFGNGPEELGGGYVAKFTGSGELLWSRHFDYARPYSVSADAAGNAVVSGRVTMSVDFGGGLRTANGSGDVFLLKLDAEGNHSFSDVFGDAEQQNCYGMDIDGQDRIYLAGTLEGTIDFGPETVQSAGWTDVFVAGFGADASYRFGDSVGDYDTQVAWALSAASNGDFAIVGTANGSPDFGGGPLTSNGLGDIFFAYYDHEGNHLCSGMYGDTDQQAGYGVATNGTAIALTGHAYGTTTFETEELSSAGSGDVVVAVLEP
jgi:hypothetical protein